MARPAYSTRFLSALGLSGAIDYVVPVGFRAVVRDVTVFHGVFPEAINVFFRLDGLTFAYYEDLGAGRAADSQPLRVVAMAGERLSILVDSGNADVTMSGYLLTDD